MKNTYLKKGLTILLIMLMCLSSVAAAPAEADLQAVAADKEALVITFAAGDTTESVTQNLTLSASGANGTTIVWSSNNAVIISDVGAVVRPAFSAGNANVVMTATITKGEATATKEFALTVKAVDPTDTEAAEAAKTALAVTYAAGESAAGVTQDLTLPLTGLYGTTVSWASSNESYISTAGTVTLPGAETGNVTVTLTATITKNAVTVTKTFDITVKSYSIGPSGAEFIAPNKVNVLGVPAGATVKVYHNIYYNNTQVRALIGQAVNSAQSTAPVEVTLENEMVYSNYVYIYITEIGKPESSGYYSLGYNYGYSETFMTLGGTVGNQNNPLRIEVGTHGTMKAFQWQKRPNSEIYEYVNQYFGSGAWGSNIYYKVNNVLKHLNTPYYGSAGILLGTGTQTKPNANTIETVWLQENGSLRITQTITYLPGNQSFEKKWKFENLSSDKSITDMTFIHGGDTYFGGNDSSRTYWNSNLGMIYLKGQNIESYGLMGFAGTPASPAVKYFGGHYSTGNNYASRIGILPNTADSQYQDAGYQLQWNHTTLAPGQSWEVNSYEIWTEAGVLQIMAPATKTTSPGNTISYEFLVQSFLEATDTFTLTATSSNGWVTSIGGGNTIEIAGNGATKNVTVNLTVPANASVLTDILTLSLVSNTNTSVTQAAQVTTSIINTQPTPTPTPAPAPVKTLVGGVSVDNVVTQDIFAEDINATSGKFYFSTSLEGRKAKIWLTADYYKLLCLANANPELQFTWNDIKYSLPMKSIDVDAAATELTSALRGMNVVLTIDKAENAVIAEAAAAAEASGARIIAGPVDFRLEIDAGSKGKKSFDSLDLYISRMIKLNNVALTDLQKIFAMKYLPEDDSFVYAPSFAEIQNGARYITIKYRGNGCFAVIKATDTFTDIGSHWSKAIVERLAARQIVREVTEGLFAPDQDITRAEFASMLVRALGITTEAGDESFSDISNQWYASEILAAANDELVYGRGDGKFDPDDSILREEMAAMISRALEFAGASLDQYYSEDALDIFEDSARIAGYAKRDAAICAELGIIIGRENDMFAPKDNATRAEAATMIERVLKFLDFMN